MSITLSDMVDLSERSERLFSVTLNDKPVFQDKLIRVSSIQDHYFSRIQTSTLFFIWSSLVKFYSDRKFVFGPDILTRYADEILGLPNITPNGLVLPKNQTLQAYNLLHQEVAEFLTNTGVAKEISHIHAPLNIRLVNGEPDEAKDSRPRASTKLHSDIWADEPSGSLMGFICVGGSFDSATIEFFETNAFPSKLARPLDDYNLGAREFNDLKKCEVQLDAGQFVVCDPFLIHRTKRLSPGLRLTIDFRFFTYSKIESDRLNSGGRLPSYLDIDTWSDLGRQKMLVTDENLEPYIEKDKTKNSHATSMRVVEMKEMDHEG